MNKINRNCLLFFIAVCLFISGQRVGYGYVYEGKKWLTPEPYLINPNCNDASAGSPEKQIAVIQAGARAWNNEGNANFTFSYGGTTTKELPDDTIKDGYNEIMFVQDPSYQIFIDNPNVIAVTIVWSRPSGEIREITECDTGFNDVNFNFSTKSVLDEYDIDIWNVAAHELGHYLHLGDVVYTAPTMYGVIDYGETNKRDLYADDINGIRAIYGASTNTNPVLLYGSVSPTSAVEGTMFGFYVDYYDADGDAPSIAKVFIDDVPYNMSLLSGTPDNGRYSYMVQLEPKLLPTPQLPPTPRLQKKVPNAESLKIPKVALALTTLPHNFYFYFEDGQGGSDMLPIVSDPAVEEPYEGPVVSAGGVLKWNSALHPKKP